MAPPSTEASQRTTGNEEAIEIGKEGHAAIAFTRIGCVANAWRNGLDTIGPVIGVGGDGRIVEPSKSDGIGGEGARINLVFVVNGMPATPNCQAGRDGVRHGTAPRPQCISGGKGRPDGKPA